MKFKKRYLLGILFLGFLGVIHSGCFSMRTAQTKFEQEIEEKGQQTPEFIAYQVDKQKMHYVDVKGKADSVAVVFVHGSPGSADNYTDYLGDTVLSRHACLVAVDRPGFGYSGFGKEVKEMEKQAAAIRPVLEKYRAQRVILVGHSLGGPVIARLAMDYPDLVDGMVMVAPSIDPQLEGNPWWRKVLNFPLFSILTPKALRTCNREIIPLRDELNKMIPLWSKITIPVTVIQGGKDKLVPMGNAEFARKMLTNSSRVKIEILEGEGHFILWSEMDLVKAAIKDLIYMN